MRTTLTAAGVPQPAYTIVYAADASGQLTGAARFALPRIYVPKSGSNTVDEIDPATVRVVAHAERVLLETLGDR